MTYSHNIVRNNLKMASTSATSTIRLKNVSKGGSSSGGGDNVGDKSSPPTTPPATAHSNSIASSTNTNNNNHHLQQQQQRAMSTTPPNCIMSSGASISPSSVSSNGSGSYFPSRRQQRNWQQQQQQQQQQNQRRSPQEKENNGGNGSYFGNNNQQYYQSNGKRHGGGGGSAQKQQRDGQKSPNAHVRFSPAVILGGNNGNCNAAANVHGSGGSARKSRPKSSPIICSGGKISPTYPNPLTHFAGSKCFDAPAANALPKPPEHWTISKVEQKIASSAGPGLHGVLNARASYLHAADAHTFGGHVVKSSKRNLLDDFDTHNLKLLLNVQS